MKRDWNAMAQGILDAVGGPENISGMTHCATRLRLKSLSTMRIRTATSMKT